MQLGIAVDWNPHVSWGFQSASIHTLERKGFAMIGNRPGKRTQHARRLNGPSRTRNGCYPDRFHRAGLSALKNTSPSGNHGTRFDSRHREIDGRQTTEPQALTDMLQDFSLLHAYILRRTIALTSEQAWHIAGGDERLLMQKRALVDQAIYRHQTNEILSIIQAKYVTKVPDKLGRSVRMCSICNHPIISRLHKQNCWLYPVTEQLRDLSMRLKEAAEQSQESREVHPEHLENSERLVRLEAL